MVDDWGWVGVAENDVGRCEVEGRRLPRRVDCLVGEAAKLWHPSTDVVAGWVELTALGDWIEDTEIGGGVGAGSGDPLPVAGVLGWFGVDEEMAEPALAFAPVDEQVFDQERSGDHSDSVVHPSSCSELAHAGVDDWIAGLAVLPGMETVRVVAPLDLVVFALDRMIDHLWGFEEHVGVPVSPSELADEPFAPGGAARNDVEEGPRCNSAKSEVCRQLGGALDRWDVAGIEVVVDRLEPACQCSVRCVVAWFNDRPIKVRECARHGGGERVGWQDTEACVAARRWFWQGSGDPLSPKWCEHLGQRALAGKDGAGFSKQRSPMGDVAGAVQIRGDCVVSGAPKCACGSVEVQRMRIDGSDDLRYEGPRVADDHRQFTA